MRLSGTTDTQRGSAAIEMALGMVLLAALLMILVEGTNALIEYSQLQNAAMEGARMIARQAGDTTGVADFVQSLFLDADSNSTLGGAAPVVTVSAPDANNNVKVQVDHVFSFFFNAQQSARSSSNPSGLLDSDSLTISASVTMAVAGDS
jgi:Flp pilus assembly protein TadG